MEDEFRKDGTLDVRLSDDRCQALLTIHPAMGGGLPVTAEEVMEHLGALSINVGIRDSVIQEVVQRARDYCLPVTHIVIAENVVPCDGQDGKVHYTLPIELLSRPLPTRKDGSNLPDWFSLLPGKMVVAGQELATITPPRQGMQGKTVTWPIQTVSPRPAMPPSIMAGTSVRVSENGLQLFAEQDGYAWLQGDRLIVSPLRLIEAPAIASTHVTSTGAVFLDCVEDSQVRAAGIVAIKGNVIRTEIRAHGDVFLQTAESCSIIATGNVYVTEALINCEVNTKKRLVALGKAQIVGGVVCATGGVDGIFIGSPEFATTRLLAGQDRFSSLRAREIQEELHACDANIARITQALKPFATLAVHTTLTEDKRALVQKLQAQRQSQEAQLKELHNERRLLSISTKEKIDGEVRVEGIIYPGVWIEIGSAVHQMEVPASRVKFVGIPGGKSVEMRPLKAAA